MSQKTKKYRTNIKQDLNDASETINNSDFVGEAINTVVDHQETIVITLFRMLTTLVVGFITVITAVLNIPFKIFTKKEEF